MLIAIHKFVSKPSHRKGSVNKPNTTTEGIDTTISFNNSFYCSECIFRQLSVFLSENECLKLSSSRFSFLKDKNNLERLTHWCSLEHRSPNSKSNVHSTPSFMPLLKFSKVHVGLKSD